MNIPAKKRNLLVSVFFAVMLLFVAMVFGTTSTFDVKNIVHAEMTESYLPDIVYALEKDSYTVKGFDYTSDSWTNMTPEQGQNIKIVIPATYDDGSGAKNITKIGEDAFHTKPDNELIDKRITSLDLSNAKNLTVIDTGAFWNNKYLPSLTIPNSVTSIGNSAFRECSGFKGNLTIPDSVISIGIMAFGNCGFKGNLNIGSSVTSIGNSAFSTTKFTGNLTIPDSVTSIGESAFDNCSSFSGTLTLPKNSEFTKIENRVFQQCSKFTGNLIIPDSVTSIGNSAFSNCSNFTNIVIPDSVTSIGNLAFKYCDGLINKLAIPNSVTSIGESAFEFCSKLDGVLVIPDSVISIGSLAFKACSNLTYIYLPKEATYGTDIFQNITEAVIVAPNKTQYDVCKAGNFSAYDLTYEKVVKFDGNGGEVTGSASQTKLFDKELNCIKDERNNVWIKNSNYEFPDATKKGFFLDSYNTKSDGSGIKLEINTILTDNDDEEVTYYAQYLVDELKSINVTQAPIKTKYEAYDDFDAAGMEITANFPSGDKLITEYVVENSKRLLCGTVSLQISYTVGSLTKTTTVSIEVSKKQLEKPTVSGSKTYNGNLQEVTLNGFNNSLMSVSGNNGTDASSYNAIIELIDTENCEWVGGSIESVKIVWTIEKATYVMDDITFENKTVTENGSIHTLMVTGTLPVGVTAVYTGTNGYTQSGVSAAGIYEVTVTFQGNDNYNVIEPLTATLTVDVVKITGKVNGISGGIIFLIVLAVILIFLILLILLLFLLRKDKSLGFKAYYGGYFNNIKGHFKKSDK